jgi:hypothetical protein
VRPAIGNAPREAASEYFELGMADALITRLTRMQRPKQSADQRKIHTSIEYEERSTEQVTLEETKVSVQTGNYSVEFGQRREAFSTWSQSPGPRPGPRHILTDYGCTGRRCVFTTSVATARPRTLPPSWSERQWIPVSGRQKL